ncbi:MAG TPA: LpqB family beta-propeller domain-containing protein [Thermoanaerobaculia bacterium]|nr:LpqB family beta-propeller domain-containing protein [Thermoanaerobaculia bacterium]
MRQKALLFSASMIAVVILTMPSAYASKADDLYQQALVAERAQGDLQKAIRLYQTVVEQAGSDRGLAVRALLQLGAAYEKLGKSEAKNAYARILREFTDQSEAVTAARERLALLAQPAASQPREARGPVSRLLWTPFPDNEGEISRDGRYVSFVDWATGDMAIRDLVKNTTRRLTDVGPWKLKHPFGGQSRFSPDNRWLAYTWYLGDDTVDLRLGATDGSSTKVLLSDPSITYVEPGAFSPDGRRVLVVIERKGGQHELGILGIADQKLEVLRRFDRHAHPVAFSPDGRWILYDMTAGTEARQWELFLIPAAGGDPIPVAHHSSNDRSAGFSPAGDRILFISRRTGTPGMWSIRLRDGKPAGDPELLRPDIGEVTSLGVTNDGAFYYNVVKGFRDAFIVDLDSGGKPAGSPRRLGDTVGMDRHPVWSGDGTKVAFVSYRGSGDRKRPNQPMYVIRDLQTGSEQVVDSPARPVGGFFALSWSPDEKFFAVNGVDSADQRALYLVEAKSGQAAVVAPHPGPTTPAWSADGNVLYYPGRNDNRATIVAYDRATAERRIVHATELATNINALAVSRDGAHIAFRELEPDYEKEDLIQIVPVTGGKPREILREPVEAANGNIAGNTGLAFTPDGRYVLFGRRVPPGSGNIELWRVSVEGGKAERLGLTMPRLTGISVHPDGRQLAFTAGENVGELWVLENFLPRENR